MQVKKKIRNILQNIKIHKAIIICIFVLLATSCMLLVVNNTMVDIRVESKEGFNSTYSGNNFIVLNTTLTKDLINEGLARETVSKIQQIRKNNDFDVADRVRVYYDGSEEYTKDIEDYIEFVKEETLAVEFIKDTCLTDIYDINDYKVGFKVEKI